jgi:Cu/Ag efflux protein CusF
VFRAQERDPLSASHPASSDAVAAPERQVSKTLAYTRADAPSPRPIADVTVSQQGAHEGHGDKQAEGTAQKTVTAEGRVVATVPNSGQVVVEHEAIKGFMDAMTMGYPVDAPSQVEGLKPGDRVRFTIDIPKKTIVKVEKTQ